MQWWRFALTELQDGKNFIQCHDDLFGPEAISIPNRTPVLEPSAEKPSHTTLMGP